MRVYRLYRRRRRESAFTGEGARIVGARWNLPGTPVVYACSTVSLCLLEFRVHFDPDVADVTRLGLEYRWAEIPDTLAFLEIREADLPANWSDTPWPRSAQERGTKWLKEEGRLAVSVPSVVVPMERNFLLNPQHPDFSAIRLGPPSAFEVDPRLFTR